MVPYLEDLDLDGDERLEEVRDLIVGWDHQQDARSAGAAAFEAWWRHLLLRTFTPAVPEGFLPQGNAHERWYEAVRRLAAARGKSKGQLVREAIATCYQTSFGDLPARQRQALSAYQGGFISIGKLAREMGMHVLQLRSWLAERGIAQQVVYGDEDAARA
jgi:hypothetical protein